MSRKLQNKKILSTLITVMIISTNALAATVGSITLSGNIPGATAIVVVAEAGYDSLDLSTTQTNTKIATVREINNTAAGYAVTLASTNSGALKNGSVGSITYSATYNDVSVTLSSTPVTVTSQGAQSSIINVTKDLDISYKGVNTEDYMAGTYSDTLTFTISAN